MDAASQTGLNTLPSPSLLPSSPTHLQIRPTSRHRACSPPWPLPPPTTPSPPFVRLLEGQCVHSSGLALLCWADLDSARNTRQECGGGGGKGEEGGRGGGEGLSQRYCNNSHLVESLQGSFHQVHSPVRLEKYAPALCRRAGSLTMKRTLA